MALAGGHVDPGASLRLVLVVAQRHRGLPLDELQDGGHRGRVFGQFLALSKTEDHRLDLFIVEQRAAEDAFVGRLASFARSLMCMYDVIVERPLSFSQSSLPPPGDLDTYGRLDAFPEPCAVLPDCTED